MARRRQNQEDDRFDRLLKVAQVLNLFQAPQQAARGENIRAALALLGLQQGDKDREFRGREAEATRLFTGSQNEADRSYRTGEREASQTFVSGQSEAERAARSKEAEASRMFTGEQGEKDRSQRGELAGKQLEAANRGNSIQALQVLLGLPGMDVPEVLSSSGDPTFAPIGQKMQKKAMDNKVANAATMLNAVTDQKAYDTALSTVPPDVVSNLPYGTGNQLKAKNDLTPFLPASWDGAPPVGALAAAGVQPGTPAPGATQAFGSLFGIPMPVNNNSLRESIFGKSILDPNDPGTASWLRKK